MTRASRRRIVSLTVEPTAGLGNRMRAMAAAIELARRLACALRLVWTRTPALGCRFDELFQPLPGVTVAEHSWTMSRIERGLGTRLGFYHYLTEPEIELRRRGGGFDDLAGVRRPYLITCARFLDVRVQLEQLRPIDTIMREVDRTAAAFTPYTVGMHIRRGENDPATHEPLTAPLDSFLTAMQRQIDADPRTNFFLATDSRTEERRVVAAFGSRIITLPKSLDRRSTAAIRAAMVDLLCLARTPVILGSYFSSFTELAAEIGGSRLIVVREKGVGDHFQHNTTTNCDSDNEYTLDIVATGKK